jgi:membrane dipeptidase
MIIVDAHLDISWNALQWNRDLTQSVPAIRESETGAEGPGRGMNTVAFPEMLQGRVAISFATLLARSTGTPIPHIDYNSPAQANAIAQGQLAYYHALHEQGVIRLIADSIALETHLEVWKQWEETPNERQVPPLGFVISMESADPILNPWDLERWWASGLRIIGPAHYGPGRYSGGTSTALGLTTLGESLLKEMSRLGFVLDMTHFTDKAFWQAHDLFEGPILASHNNCRSLVSDPRQFDDEQLKAIIARGGVIGAAFDTWMLQEGWVRGASDPAGVTLANVVDHIDHVCQLAGNSEHAAIGSDLDGGFGKEQTPSDLETIADLQKLPDLLAARGYTQTDIENILHANWIRLLRKTWA